MSTFAQFPADGSTAVFTFTFPYLDAAHIKVTVNNIIQVAGAHYDLVGVNGIHFRPQFIPGANTVVMIRRETPLNNPLVAFQNGAVLSQDDLNVAVRQNLYLTQEIKDKYEGMLEAGLLRVTNGTNVGAQAMIDAVVQSVLDSALLDDLQSRIGDIDANGESVLDQNVRLTSLQATVDALVGENGEGIATLIQNEANARIAGDAALVDTIALIGAKNGANTAFIADLNTLKVSSSESFAQRFSALSAADSTNYAAIVTEQTARANGDTANASSISTLISTVNGQSASIQTLQNVVIGNGGLTAQYMVKLDVNGRVSGFGLYNSSSGSEFAILANKFSIVDPGLPNTAPKVPFTVTGGVVYMSNVVINGALIQDLTVGTLKIADSAITTAKIPTGAVSNVWSSFAGSETATSFTAGTWKLVSGVNVGSPSGSQRFTISVSVDCKALGSGPAAYTLARIRRTNTNTVLWQGFEDSGITTYKDYARITGTFTIDDTPPAAGLNTYVLEIYATGTSAVYYKSGIVVTELKR